MTAGISATGSEFQVNSHADTRKKDAQIAAMSEGGFLITWDSWAQDGSSYGIFGQRFDSSGTAIGEEFRINDWATNFQVYSASALLSDGSLVVAWHSGFQDGGGIGVYGKRFGPTGDPVGTEFRVNIETEFDQSFPKVAPLNDGGFVVVWQSWRQDGNESGVFARRYASDGSGVGTEFRVNSTTIGNQGSPSLTALNDGGFTVVWQSSSQNSATRTHDVYGRRFDAAAEAVGTEFRINTYLRDEQKNPVIATLAGGGIVAVWESVREDGGPSQDGSGHGLYGQMFAPDGSPMGSEFQVNVETDGDQRQPAVIDTPDGGFVISWHSSSADGTDIGVFSRRFDANGEPLGEDVRISGQHSDAHDWPSVAHLTNGGFAATWAEQQDGAWSVKARIFAAEYWGTSGDDSIYEPAGLNWINSQAGNDLVRDGAGNDVVFAGRGNDTIESGAGDDFVWVNQGDDLFIDASSGPGNDTVIGGFGRDTLLGGNGNDILRGRWGKDSLDGGAGNDTLDPGIGDDIVTGGEGSDLFRFRARFDLGDDVIRDFEMGVDRFRFDWLSFQDITVSQDGSDTVLKWATGSVTLQQVTATELSENDFSCVFI
ncbi:calcium-binding protein [Lutimaribacter marinistellae]|uniref:Calcium-binding protein n=1 Tax=Lutimaribacter marinistellae TaxID=1820329 RepID=A0ABV7TN01_9RHOB